MDTLKNKMGNKIRLVVKWVAIIIIMAILAYCAVLMHRVLAFEGRADRDPILDIMLLVLVLIWWNTYKLRKKP